MFRLNRPQRLWGKLVSGFHVRQATPSIHERKLVSKRISKARERFKKGDKKLIKLKKVILSGGFTAVIALLVLGFSLAKNAVTEAGSPTPGVESTQTTPQLTAEGSSPWLFAALGVGALAFGVSGFAVARHSK